MTKSKSTNKSGPSLGSVSLVALLALVAAWVERRPEPRRSPASAAGVRLCAFVDTTGGPVKADLLPDSLQAYKKVLSSPARGYVAAAMAELDRTVDSGRNHVFHVYRFPEKPTPQAAREDYSAANRAEDKGLICGGAAKRSVADLLTCIVETQDKYLEQEQEPMQLVEDSIAGLNALLPSRLRVSPEAFGKEVFQIDPQFELPTSGWRTRGTARLNELHSACQNPTCDTLFTQALDAWNWFGAKHDIALATEVMRGQIGGAVREELSRAYGVKAQSQIEIAACEKKPGELPGPKGQPGKAGSEAHAGAPQPSPGSAQGQPGLFSRFADAFRNLVRELKGEGSASIIGALFDQSGSSVLGTEKMACPAYFPREYRGSGGPFDFLAKDASGAYRDPLTARFQSGGLAAGDFAGALLDEHRGELTRDLASYYFEVETEAYLNDLFQSRPLGEHAALISKLADDTAACHPDGAAAGRTLIAKLAAELPTRDAARFAEAQSDARTRAALASACVTAQTARIEALRDYLGMNWTSAVTLSDDLHRWAEGLDDARRAYMAGKLGQGVAAQAVEKVVGAAETLAVGLAATTPVGKGALLLDSTVLSQPLLTFEGAGECNFIALRAQPATTDPGALVYRCGQAFGEFVQLAAERDGLVQAYPALAEAYEGKPGYEALAATLPADVRALADASKYLGGCMGRFAQAGAAPDPGPSARSLADRMMKAQSAQALTAIHDELKSLCSPAKREEAATQTVLLNPVFMSSFYDCGRKRFGPAYTSLQPLSSLPVAASVQDTWPKAFDSPGACDSRIDGAFLGCRLYRESAYKKGIHEYFWSMGKHTIQAAQKFTMAYLQFMTPTMGLKLPAAGTWLRSIGRGGLMGGGIAAVFVGSDSGWDRLFHKPASVEEDHARALREFRLGYGSFDELKRAYEALKSAEGGADPRVRAILEGAITGMLFDAFTHAEPGIHTDGMRAPSPGAAAAADAAIVRLWADLRETRAFESPEGPKLGQALGGLLDSRLQALYPQLTQPALAKLSLEDKVGLLEDRATPPTNDGRAVVTEAIPRDPAQTLRALQPGDVLSWSRFGAPKTGRFLGYDAETLMLTLDEGSGHSVALPLEDFLTRTADWGSVAYVGARQGAPARTWNFALPWADLAGAERIVARLSARDGIRVVTGGGAASAFNDVLRETGQLARVAVDPVARQIALGEGATLQDVMEGVAELRRWAMTDSRLGELLRQGAPSTRVSARIWALEALYRARAERAERGDAAAVARFDARLATELPALKAAILSDHAANDVRERLGLALDETIARGERALELSATRVAQGREAATRLADIRRRYASLFEGLGTKDLPYAEQLVRVMEDQGRPRAAIEDLVRGAKKSCGI